MIRTMLLGAASLMLLAVSTAQANPPVRVVVTPPPAATNAVNNALGNAQRGLNHAQQQTNRVLNGTYNRTIPRWGQQSNSAVTTTRQSSTRQSTTRQNTTATTTQSSGPRRPQIQGRYSARSLSHKALLNNR